MEIIRECWGEDRQFLLHDKGKYKETRTFLGNIRWNNLLKSKTATECRTYLKEEIDDITKIFVPL